jgi:hypothetical protein
MEMDILQFALEERSDGAMKMEREYVFYARLGSNFVFPQTGDVERQEQWTIKIAHTDANAAQGDIRVRKTDFFDHGDLGRSEYVLTTKIRDAEGGVPETPIPSTADQFEHFKKLAETGMLKDRYTYAIAGTELAWEVDAYLKPGGGYWPWVKIDLEVPEDAPADFPIPEFPFEAEEWIKGQNGERLPAEEAKVRELYETMFLTKNPGAKNTQAAAATTAAGQDDQQDDQTPQQGEGPKPVYQIAKEEWDAKWPELDGVPVHPDMVPGDEIFKDNTEGVQSEPDENRAVVGVEQIQEFNSKVEQLAKDMNVRLLHLSIGRGYLNADELRKLGGPYGSQYYFVKNPAEGSNVMGMGFHFNHPTLSSDQVHF